MNRLASVFWISTLLLTSAAHGQPLPLSGDLVVNSTLSGEQLGPDIAADAADTFQIVWYTQLGDPAHWDTRIRRLSSAGALGTDSLLSQSTTGDQRAPAVDASDGGDWVAIWSSDHAAATVDRPFGRWTTSGGTLLGSETAFAIEAPNDISLSGMAAVGEDSLVGVWRNDGNGNAVQGNFRDRNGVQFGVTAIAASAAGSVPDAAGLYGDHWVAVWHAADADAHGAYFRCHNLGQAIEPGALAHAVVTGDQTLPAVASDGQFRFVIVWQQGSEIRGRLFGIDGNGTDCAPTTEEFTVSTPGEPGLYPKVDMAPDGAFVVAWYSPALDLDNGVLAREYTKSALPVGAPFAVNATTLGAQADPAIAVSSRTFAVAFSTPDSGAAGPRNVAVRRFARRVVYTDSFETSDYWSWSAVVP